LLLKPKFNVSKSIFIISKIVFLYYLSVPNIKYISVLGILLMLCSLIQVITGVLLAFGYIPEPNVVPTVRDNEDSESKVIDLTFFVHERLVDFLFILIFLHLLRKVFIDASRKSSASV